MYYYLYIKNNERDGLGVKLSESTNYIKLLQLRDKINGNHPYNSRDLLALGCHAIVVTEYFTGMCWNNVVTEEHPKYVENYDF